MIGQLALYQELRPWMDAEGVADMLLKICVRTLQSTEDDEQNGIRALIENQVLPMLLCPAPLHVGGSMATEVDTVVASRSFARADHALPVTAQPTADRCAACSMPARAGAPLKKCSRCMEVRYCSPTCQREHWRVHKPTCHPKA